MMLLRYPITKETGTTLYWQFFLWLTNSTIISSGNGKDLCLQQHLAMLMDLT